MYALKQVENLIRKDFVKVSAFSGTAHIKSELLKHRALVVLDDQEKPIGVLTACDILERPHALVIDCLRLKKNISSDKTVCEAIEILQDEKAEALAVHEGDDIIGMVYKDELVNCLFGQINTLKTEIARAENALKTISWIQSHRVRQPVASILGLIQLIDSGPTQEEIREIVALLRKSIIELDQVIADTVNTADLFGRRRPAQDGK